MRREPGVADATPIAVATDQLADERSFLVFGVVPGSFVFRSLVFVEGRGVRGPGEAALGDAAAERLGLGVGDRLPLASGSQRVVGVYHAGVAFEDQGAALPFDTVARLRGRPGDATTIAVKVERGTGAEDVRRTLEHAFPGTVAISQPGQVARVDTSSLLVRKGRRAVRRAGARHRRDRRDEHDADGRVRAQA